MTCHQEGQKVKDDQFQTQLKYLIGKDIESANFTYLCLDNHDMFTHQNQSYAQNSHLDAHFVLSDISKLAGNHVLMGVTVFNDFVVASAEDTYRSQIEIELYDAIIQPDMNQ